MNASRSFCAAAGHVALTADAQASAVNAARKDGRIGITHYQSRQPGERPCYLLPPPIERRRGEQHHTFDDQLIVGAHAVQVQAVVEDPDEERACQRAPDRAAASEQARAADDDRGDRVELVVFARAGIAALSRDATSTPASAGCSAADRVYRKA